MKIAFMLRNLHEKGGINVYTVNLIENILKLDTESEYLFLYSDNQYLGRYADYTNVKELWVQSPSKLFWDQIGIPSVLRSENVDLVFNPKLSIPLISKSKKLLMIHGAEQFAVPDAFPWMDRVYTHIAMPLYGKFADKILTTTQLGIQDLSRYLGIDQDKFVFIHEGVHERFKILPEKHLIAARQKYNLPPKFILFVGGISPLKNFERIVSAYHQISHQIEHKLVIVGFNRFKFHRDLKSANKLIEQGKILQVGFIADEDLPAFYNLADVLVFPSLYEGFGLPVLEAMACNCPVLTSNTGCTKEVTQDAAHLVNPLSVTDIAQGLLRLIRDQDLSEHLIARGAQRVRQFSWQNTATQTLDVFRSMLE